jgi:hypothetical protein
MSRKLEQVMDSLPPDRRANVERGAANLIQEAVHEKARDLRKAGFIEKHRMREYDGLCLEPNASDGGSTPETRLKSPENPKT